MRKKKVQVWDHWEVENNNIRLASFTCSFDIETTGYLRPVKLWVGARDVSG